MHTVIIGAQIRIYNIQILDYTALHIAKKRVERIVAYPMTVQVVYRMSLSVKCSFKEITVVYISVCNRCPRITSKV